MSLNSILNTALSGLSVAQSALNVTAQNVANVNTPGYTRESVQQEETATGGQGNGVKIADIQRVANQFLDTEVRGASSNSAFYDAMNQIQNQLQSSFGSPGQQNSIAGAINQIFTSISQLATNPTQGSAAAATVNSIQSFGTQVGALASQVQSLRTQADNQAGLNVATANTDLKTIQTLNQQIVQATIGGTSTAALEDQRAQALSDLSGIMNISTFSMANGALGITTGNGITLLDTNARQLVYTPAGTVNAGTSFSQITVNGVDPVTGVVASTGTPLDGALQSGSLAGWLQMRDQELPAIAAELGQLSTTTANQLNAASNANSAVPPPASLSGRDSGLVASDPPGFTGQATFYTTDASHAVVQAVRVDFDTGQVFNPPTSGTASGTFTTLGTLTAAVTAALGGSGTLSLTNGVMSFTAGGTAAGVAIQQGGPVAGATASSRGGAGFSQFFGMNDLVKGGGPLITNSGLTTSSTLSFSGQTTLNLIGPNNQVGASVTLNFGAPPLSTPGATFADLLSQLNGASGFAGKATVGLDANGALTLTPAAGYSGYRLELGNDTSNRGGTGLALGTMFGIGSANQANVAQSFGVVGSIAANPSALQTARVDTTSGVAAGTVVLNAADNSGALALQAVAQQAVTVPAAGNLAATTTTLSGYAASLITGAATDAANTQTALTNSQALQTALQQQQSNVSSVNLDEELTNMVTLQNAYNASGRLLTTVNAMMTALMQF